MSKYATRCNDCHTQRMHECHEEARRHVERGTCPLCSAPLVRNSSLAGWYQCAGYASQSFRKPEHRDLPSCSYQTFTE
jgi:hypothetical protein